MIEVWVQILSTPIPYELVAGRFVTMKEAVDYVTHRNKNRYENVDGETEFNYIKLDEV